MPVTRFHCTVALSRDRSIIRKIFLMKSLSELQARVNALEPAFAFS
jgi:hypothetical protein